jgi:calcineurin-like phosphoesterase family protein
MNNIFITADLHFCHDNIRKHTNRPWTTCDEMDTALINNWNNVVSKNDTVYIVGDFAWKNHNHYIMALNGKKILILGNHDKMSQDYLKNFTEVHPILRRNIYNKDVTFCHYCMTTWASSCHGSWHFYGHSHGRIKEFEDSYKMDVGVDVWNYTPISWDVIEYKMSFKKKKEFYACNELEENVKKLRENNLLLIQNIKLKNGKI